MSLSSQIAGTWEYEVDECPKRKHAWDQSYAGFEEVESVLIGKCPKGIGMEMAKTLLNEGIAWSPREWKRSYPKRIYIVHSGVVYRATPTKPGISYHAFPEKPRELRDLPEQLQKLIFQRARLLHCEKEVRQWFNR